MIPTMSDTKPKFNLGQTVYHKLYKYRGVVIGVDAKFKLSEEWYEMVAKSQPPKDKPWYHVLVQNGVQNTYVAERHLEPDSSYLN